MFNTAQEYCQIAPADLRAYIIIFPDPSWSSDRSLQGSGLEYLEPQA